MSWGILYSAIAFPNVFAHATIIKIAAVVTIDSKTASLKSAQVKVFKISTVIINDREKPIAAASVGVNTPVYIQTMLIIITMKY